MLPSRHRRRLSVGADRDACAAQKVSTLRHQLGNISIPSCCHDAALIIVGMIFIVVVGGGDGGQREGG